MTEEKKTTAPVLKCTKVTVFQVEYHAIDAFMTEVFATELGLPPYECCVWEEYSNDTSSEKRVLAEPGFDVYDVKYRIEKKKWPSLHALLNVACGRGLIEPGAYVISVCW